MSRYPFFHVFLRRFIVLLLGNFSIVGFFWPLMSVSTSAYPLIHQQKVTSTSTHGFLDKAMIALLVGTKRLTLALGSEKIELNSSSRAYE
jgi:hypothetical protein